MQEAKPRRHGERAVDYGLAAMDLCGTLPFVAPGSVFNALAVSAPTGPGGRVAMSDEKW